MEKITIARLAFRDMVECEWIPINGNRGFNVDRRVVGYDDVKTKKTTHLNRILGLGGINMGKHNINRISK